VGGMNTGGAETFLMKIYRELPHDKYQMDFCVTNEKEGFYDKEIEKLGGKIIHITKKSKNIIKNFKEIEDIVKIGKYNNVIRISQHSLSALDLYAAKRGGARNLIFRSSNSNSCGSWLNRIMHKVFKVFAKKIPNVKIAPSDVAAIHMFGRKDYEQGKVKILNNGLPIQNFMYNSKKRDEIRKKLKIEDKFVIGHIGRFTKQKNHQFLIDVFNDYLAINENSLLLLIGEGELKKSIERYIEKKKIKDKVLFLGLIGNAYEMYNAMDCFVFPSLFEGMPNTVIEAQTNGLNCIISDKITTNVKLTNKVEFLPLENSKTWAKEIRVSINREKDYSIIKEKGYDINDVTKEFVKLCYK